MIKSTELREGNIILKHFEGGDGEIEEVTSRTIFDCKANPTGKFTYTGIPLTDEVLKGCGFEEEYRRVFSIKFTHRNSKFGYDWSKSFGWRFRYIGEYLEHIKYLHQLQNIFYFLTGEELNYTPLKA